MRRVVHETMTPYHRVFVHEDDEIRTLRFERNPQSSMFLSDPFESDIRYPSYFHLGLAVKPDLERVLVIGLGGGTVVKRMWRDYPWVRIDVVELDPVIVDLARAYFALPDDERIRVITGDGRAFVETAEERYDLIVVDAFDDDDLPRPFKTEEFMRAARGLLQPDGVIVYNFIGRTRGDLSRPFRSLYRTLANVFARVWVFPIRPEVFITLTEDRNIILMATDVVMRPDELLDRISTCAEGRVTVSGFERFADDLDLGPFRTGDVPILTDEPSRRRWGRSTRRQR